MLDVTVDPGEQISAGSDVATLAEMSDIKLIVNVEQKDISRIDIGQGVEVSIYALPDLLFAGIVEKIAPTSESGTGFVTFPVTIILTDDDLSAVRPGMTASANFVAEAAASE
ncbi:MAG: HlyD family efflux transporter periplasmic adaptor subunit [Caldilineaceae bacterium]|nr:HlyD family efflux transporter periplasmic adaptor subunit [Caldilineaceae bacterium]